MISKGSQNLDLQDMCGKIIQSQMFLQKKNVKLEKSKLQKLILPWLYSIPHVLHQCPTCTFHHELRKMLCGLCTYDSSVQRQDACTIPMRLSTHIHTHHSNTLRHTSLIRCHCKAHAWIPRKIHTCLCMSTHTHTHTHTHACNMHSVYTHRELVFIAFHKFSIGELQ